ncbi:MAG: hypothetical protein NXI32_03975 [bacterium]|nr:hypothetical protein [bacterium]
MNSYASGVLYAMSGGASVATGHHCFPVLAVSSVAFWAQTTGGYADIERTRDFSASVRYSIDGDLSENPEDRRTLQ